MMGEQCLVTPLMKFLRIVPILMASLALMSLVLLCINMRMNSQPVIRIKFGMDLLLCTLYVIIALGWLFFFYHALCITIPMLEMHFFFLNLRTTIDSIESHIQEDMRGPAGAAVRADGGLDGGYEHTVGQI